MALKVEVCGVLVAESAQQWLRWLACADLLETTRIGDELDEIDEPGAGSLAPIRVALVEAPSLMRDGIVRLLSDSEITVAWVGDSVTDLFASPVEFNVAVVDFDHIGHGFKASDIEQVIRRRSAVLLCATPANDLTLEPLIAAGVAGVVSKSTGYQELLAAVRAVAHGDSWMSSSLDTRPPGSGLALSAQQVEVLRRYAAGLKLATVARQLRISPNTVSYHLRMIRQKSEQAGTRATTQRDMLRLAQRLGIEAIDVDG
ncbi:MAG: LuxR C-terminal-related transcriptional regulator [Candidatus Nanopelagicales bacterium]